MGEKYTESQAKASKNYQSNMDRITLWLRQGEKDKIKEAAAALSMSVNEYILSLIIKDRSRPAVCDNSLLAKWNIPRKYYEMVQECSYDKESGYYILLKDGCTNDETGGRVLTASKLDEIRLLINKSHQVKKITMIDGLPSDVVEQLWKWQIPKKYFKMIEGIGHNEVRLKKEYYNDYVKSSVIKVEKAKELRYIMKYTREV